MCVTFSANLCLSNGSSSDRNQELKVKLSLCVNRAPRHEGVLGEWKYSSTHSSSRYEIEVSGQLHAPAALPPGKDPMLPIV
jgi:hypothetical protein